MKLNKIYSILLLSALAMPIFTACESDTDSNPVFQEAPTFVLNESAYGTNNTYDLGVANANVQLTCNQPEYGFPVATTYKVEVSFDEAFADGSYIELGTTYNNTRIEISAAELNASLTELWGILHEGVDIPTEAQAIYFRLRAGVTGQTIGNSISNVICLPKVLMSADVVSLEIPQYMYLCGTMSDWSIWQKMGPVFGVKGQYYTVIYVADGGAFKFGTKENEWLGYDDPRLTINDNANAGVSGEEGGNIHIDKGGFYTVTMKTAVKGKDYAFTMNIAPAQVYVFGDAVGSWDWSDTWLFADGGNGKLVSPVIPGDNEIRMTVRTDFSWWQTEFTLKDGKDIAYREVDIPNNWKENAGDEYSVSGVNGKVIELDFSNGVGTVK